MAPPKKKKDKKKGKAEKKPRSWVKLQFQKGGIVATMHDGTPHTKKLTTTEQDAVNKALDTIKWDA